MQLIEVPVAAAAGGLLAHNIGERGFRVRKGTRLSEEDLARLRDAGVERVMIARLAEDDVGENEAALRLAAVAAGPGLETTRASTGRCNLDAAAPGLARIDADAVTEANRVHEGITIATVPAWDRVAAGQTVATVKIIPFAVPLAAVEAVEGILTAGHGVVALAPFRAKRVGLVQTRLPGVKETVLDKTTETTRQRLESLGGTLAAERRCAHDVAAVAEAIQGLADGSDLLIVIGASAIIDRQDVVPAAVRAAGGVIDHFGMPVDPGNLTLLARLGDRPVLGFPGSFRSPRLHGCDWLLWRIFADAPAGGREAMAMGVGGLLKDIPGRPMPRHRAVRGSS